MTFSSFRRGQCVSECAPTIAGEDDQPDYWQLKEMMCKPWTDVVSQRVVLRRVNDDPSSGHQGFLAKWDKPQGNQILPFAIEEAGIS